MKTSLKKRLTVLILALSVIVMVFSGCAKDTPETSDTAQPQTTTKETATQAKEEEPAEPDEIIMALPIIGAGNTNDLQMIEDAVNEISIAEANVKVKIEAITFSSYDQQMTLMLSGNEPLDLMVIALKPISTYANRQQIISLNDLLDEYGQGIKEQLGEYINSTKISGQIYALPTIRDFCRGGGFNVRDDLVEKYNIDLSAIKTLEDMTPVLKAVKEGEGEDFYPLIISTSGTVFLDTYVQVDQLGDSNGVLIKRGTVNTDVVMEEETQEYKDTLALLHEWYEAGYIQKDIATTQESYGSLLKAGIGFTYLTNCKPGIEQIAKRNTGYDMTTVQILEYSAATDNVANICWAVAQNTEKPEAAVKFLNLMYTNAELETILTWGIEGTHYVINDEGFATYPEGVTSDTSGWTLNTSWLMGNQFLTPHWEGEPADLWDRQKAANDSATKSLALGFTFDNEDVKAEVAAIESVRSEYQGILENGVADPDELLPEYIQKLKDAGIEKVIAEKQAQLDEWLAANGN